jgi:hypothetical protein
MSEATETATAPAAEAPRTMPTNVPETPAPSADYHPDQDTAAGLAAFRAAKAEASPADSAPSAAEKADVVAAAVADATGTPAPAAAEPPAPADDVVTDAKLNKIFGRIAALERERDEARSSLSRFEQEAKDANEAKAFRDSFKKNPVQALKEAGWSQDAIAEYVLKGDEAVSPQISAQDAKIRELEQKLQHVERQRITAEQQRNIENYVNNELPKALSTATEKLPYLHTYYETERDRAQAVFDVMRNVYQQQKTADGRPVELTPLEAAQAVENVLAEQAKRFSRRASSESPAPSKTAPAPKPSAPTLTNKPTSSPAPVEPEDGHTPNYQAAIEALRAARKA